MKIVRMIVDFHWQLFNESAAYFLICVPFMVIYFFVRKTWYKMKGKNFWGQNPEEAEKEFKHFKNSFRSTFFYENNDL